MKKGGLKTGKKTKFKGDLYSSKGVGKDGPGKGGMKK